MSQPTTAMSTPSAAPMKNPTEVLIGPLARAASESPSPAASPDAESPPNSPDAGPKRWSPLARSPQLGRPPIPEPPTPPRRYRLCDASREPGNPRGRRDHHEAPRRAGNV